MSVLYNQLGLKTAWRKFSGDHGADPRAGFERQLRDVDAGTPALNLSSSVVHLAAEIAAFEPDLDNEQRIALILLVVVSLAALEEGSTRFPVTGAQSVEPMRRLLSPLCGEAFGAYGAERMRIAIERILTSNTAPGVIGATANDYKPLVYQSPFIYQHRILSAEIGLARRLAALMETTRPEVDEVGIHDLLSELETRPTISNETRVAWSEEQRAAIRLAVTAPLTIISGGPGSGKTSIVLAILKVLIGAGLAPKEIALAAPTGKAAYRIGESIRRSFPGDPTTLPWKAGPEPTTVHRLLGYSPTRRRFRYDRNNPLEARVVIVDESSMLDLDLMSRLLDALRPDARLVLLGDADQLPSISAGAVFRDLVPAASDADSALSRGCVRLSRSYRMDTDEKAGRSIFNLAKAINVGNGEIFAASQFGGEAIVTRRAAAEQLEFVGAEWLDEETPNAAFLERWHAMQVLANGEITDLRNRTFSAIEGGFAPADCDSLRLVFNDVARSRILCVTRVLDSGSERINSGLHRRVAHDQGVSPDRHRFIVGEPVMVLRNDYERMLFNGDQGVVLRVQLPDGQAAPMAVFSRGDNFAAFPLDALKEHLELCYAMTVHKAQGSEFDSVAVIMPNTDIPILSREILYTAVSRARRAVAIIGSSDVIGAGLARRIERYSGVREQLAQCLSESQRV
jgi:exodeoxyribonuclease V alpha subunit